MDGGSGLTGRKSGLNQIDCTRMRRSLGGASTKTGGEVDKAIISRRALMLGALGLSGVAAGIYADHEINKWAHEDTVPSNPNIPLKNDFYRKIARYKELRAKRALVCYHNASTPVSIENKTSRMDYVRALVAQTSLPQKLKDLLPYLPYEESGYRLSASSPAGAKGPWQFMKETGKRFGLIKGDYDEEDNRCDFELASQAAIKYVQEIYAKLSTDPNYLKLKSRFGLGETFIALITLNAYNSGTAHMQNALGVMANDNDVQVEVEKYGKAGDEGLMLYLTERYILLYEDKQKRFEGRYYHKESAAYTYKIQAYRSLVEGVNAAPEKEGELMRSADKVEGLISGFKKTVGLLMAGGLAIGLGALAKRGGSGNGISNKEMIAAGAIVGAPFVAGVILNQTTNIIDTTFDDASEFVARYASDVDKYDEGDIRSKGLTNYLLKIATNIKHGPMARNKWKDRNHDITATTPFEMPKLYNSNLAYADSAFELYEKTSDTKYLSIAHFFYHRCDYLLKGQFEAYEAVKDKSPAEQAKVVVGGFNLPPGGLPELNARRLYLDAALKVVDAEF